MWKYGMIKVDYPDLWEKEKHCEIVELYEDNEGKYTSFTKARINSFEELTAAYTDILRDGVNTWFSENGIFTWNSEDKFWDWQKKQ